MVGHSGVGKGLPSAWPRPADLGWTPGVTAGDEEGSPLWTSAT